MIQVSNPNKFPDNGYIAFFSGKSLEDAICLAEKWSKENNIKVYSYYSQRVPGKSILVSYQEKLNV